MRKILIITSILFFSLSTAFAAKPKKVRLTPVKSVAKVLVQGKKTHTYYALSSKSKTEYLVKGPGKIYINVRSRAKTGDFKTESFSIKYKRGKFVKTLKIPTLKVSALKYKNEKILGLPTRKKQLVIKVPPGTHRYVFNKTTKEPKAHIQVYFEKKPRPAWTEIKPENTIPSQDIRYVKSGVVRTYHQLSETSSFNFSITDSERIKVLLRPEFSYVMLDEIELKIRLTNQNKNTSKVYKINSHRSNELEFVTEKKKIPGTSQTFYLNLAKPSSASEKYSISLESGAKSAIIRLFLDSKKTKKTATLK